MIYWIHKCKICNTRISECRVCAPLRKEFPDGNYPPGIEIPRHRHHTRMLVCAACTQKLKEDGENVGESEQIMEVSTIDVK